MMRFIVLLFLSASSGPSVSLWLKKTWIKVHHRDTKDTEEAQRKTSFLLVHRLLFLHDADENIFERVRRLVRTQYLDFKRIKFSGQQRNLR